MVSWWALAASRAVLQTDPQPWQLLLLPSIPAVTKEIQAMMGQSPSPPGWHVEASSRGVRFSVPIPVQCTLRSLRSTS